MEAAVESLKGGKGLREASRLYNIPLESLKRRVTGMVEMDCRPGPATLLTKNEEDEIEHVQMADMGYGLTCEAHGVFLYIENVNEVILSKLERLVNGGFKDLKHVTQILLFICSRPCLIVGLCVPIKK